MLCGALLSSAISFTASAKSGSPFGVPGVGGEDTKPKMTKEFCTLDKDQKAIPGNTWVDSVNGSIPYCLTTVPAAKDAIWVEADKIFKCADNKEWKDEKGCVDKTAAGAGAVASSAP